MKLALLILLLSYISNSQVFTPKRDLVNDNINKDIGVFSIGVGASYLNNELLKIKSNKIENKLYSEIESQYFFIPNLFFDYQFSKTSDFSIRLNLDYFNTEIKQNQNFIPSIQIDNNVNVSNLTSKSNLRSYDIDLIMFYDVMSFKSVSIFGGFKTRFQNYEKSLAITNDMSPLELLHIIHDKAVNNDINYSLLFGASYNGEISLFEYEIYFQYCTLLNNINFKNQKIIYIPDYKVSNYGIGLNLKYKLN